MNTNMASALLRYIGQIRKRLGRDVQPAARYMRHGQVRNDPKKPSGAARRHQLRWGGPYRYDAKAKVWRLQRPDAGLLRQAWVRLTGQSVPARTPRGRLANPTALR